MLQHHDGSCHDVPVGQGWGWAGSAGEYLRSPREVVLAGLRDHHIRLMGCPSSASQDAAWRTELAAMTNALGSSVAAEPETAERWSLVFEYEIPLDGGRRRDVVVLAGQTVVVIEFKSHDVPTQADVDQVCAYGRDLEDYHAGSHGRRIVPVLALPGVAPGFAHISRSDRGEPSTCTAGTACSSRARWRSQPAWRPASTISSIRSI